MLFVLYCSGNCFLVHSLWNGGHAFRRTLVFEVKGRKVCPDGLVIVRLGHEV